MDIYNYDKHINIITTPSGDKVITMNSTIFTEMINAVFDGQVKAKEDGRLATARNLNKLWSALYDKEDASCVRK